MVKRQYIIWNIIYSFFFIYSNSNSFFIIASPWVPEVNKFNIYISLGQSSNETVKSCQYLHQLAELDRQRIHQANLGLHSDLNYMLQQVQAIHYKAIERVQRKTQNLSNNIRLLSELEMHCLLEGKTDGKLGTQGVLNAESAIHDLSRNLPSVQLNNYMTSELRDNLKALEEALLDPTHMTDEQRVTLRLMLKNSTNIMQSTDTVTAQEQKHIKNLIQRLKDKILLDPPPEKYPKHYTLNNNSIAMEYGLMPHLALGWKLDYHTLPNFVQSKNTDILGVEFFTKYQLYVSKTIVIAVKPLLAFIKDENIKSYNPKDFDWLCELHILTAYVTNTKIAKFIYLAEFGGVVRFGNSIEDDYFKYNVTQLIELSKGFKVMVQRFGYISQQDWSKGITRDQITVGKSFTFNNTEITVLVGAFLERYKKYKGPNNVGLLINLWIKY